MTTFDHILRGLIGISLIGGAFIILRLIGKATFYFAEDKKTWKNMEATDIFGGFVIFMLICGVATLIGFIGYYLGNWVYPYCKAP